jgi:myo-inositol-hexaphosphate 3-phosphohydrolase
MELADGQEELLGIDDVEPQELFVFRYRDGYLMRHSQGARTSVLYSRRGMERAVTYHKRYAGDFVGVEIIPVKVVAGESMTVGEFMLSEPE